MKKFAFCISLLFTGMLHLAAQSTITLTFTAVKDGVHQGVDSILATNLSRGGDTTLRGQDTVLVLDHQIGIGKPLGRSTTQMVLYPAYPNPARGTSLVRLSVQQEVSVSLKLYDLTGRVLASYDNRLCAGEHTFQLVTGCASSHLLVAESSGERVTQRLVNAGAQQGDCQLIYSGFQPFSQQFRLGKSAFTWEPGDNLMFIGYSGMDADTLTGAPVQSQLLIFDISPFKVYPPGAIHCQPGGPTAVVSVLNPVTGKLWMDRNLGAIQVAAQSADADAYGDLYQWGRFSDGHQCRSSDTTYTLSSADQPGHNLFVITPNSPYDWRSPQNDLLWQGVSGINNPCPIGYRIPTEAELVAEYQSWLTQNADGAFLSPLKWTVAGMRLHNTGQIIGDGFGAAYRSSTLFGANVKSLSFGGGYANVTHDSRGSGTSVRCIKD